MQTAIAVLVIIFAGAWLCAYMGLWRSIDNIKDSLEYIKRFCNNESEIKQSENKLGNLILKSHKELLTEIACLATKNNEDIKRIKDGWQEGDVIESNGELYYVLAPVYNTNDDRNPCGYRLIDQDRTYSYSAKELVENATLIKHTSGLSGIFDK